MVDSGRSADSAKSQEALLAIAVWERLDQLIFAFGRDASDRIAPRTGGVANGRY